MKLSDFIVKHKVKHYLSVSTTNEYEFDYMTMNDLSEQEGKFITYPVAIKLKIKDIEYKAFITVSIYVCIGAQEGTVIRNIEHQKFDNQYHSFLVYGSEREILKLKLSI